MFGLHGKGRGVHWKILVSVLTMRTLSSIVGHIPKEVNDMKNNLPRNCAGMSFIVTLVCAGITMGLSERELLTSGAVWQTILFATIPAGVVALIVYALVYVSTRPRVER